MNYDSQTPLHLIKSPHYLEEGKGSIPGPNYDWILIDGRNLAMRIFATHKHLKTEMGGFPTGLTHGFIKHLILLKRRFDGKIIVTWDRGRERREKLFPDYKCSRRDRVWADAELYEESRGILSTVLALTGCRQAAKRGVEADDIIFTLVHRLVDASKLIVSNDHDFYPLLSRKDTHIYLSKRKRSVIYDGHLLNKEFNCTPYQYFMALCLAGDKTDDIPGLHRVGLVTALKMVRGEKEYPEGWEAVRERNAKLIKMYDEHPLTFSKHQFDGEALEETLEHFELQQLLDHLHMIERLGE